MSWRRPRSSEIAAIGVGGVAIGLVVASFAQARATRPALVSSADGAIAIAWGRTIRIPSGAFLADPRDWDVPQARAIAADLDAFDLDEVEVTEGAYAACVMEGACAAVAMRGRSELPVTSVSMAEARTFCRARGGDVPTALQFLRAAGGPTGARFPWGDVGPVCATAAWGLVDGPCAFGENTPTPGGTHPRGNTPEGVMDLSGNVAEWVRGPDDRAEVRGGSFRSAAPTDLKTWKNRVESAVDARFDDVGFRCARPVR